MALRVYWHENPRIIEVLAPLTEISIQDLSDQIKDIEDEPANLAFPILIKTFGKQPLGGGIFVGITAELQNAKVSFQARDGTDVPPEVLCTISGGNLVAIDENGDPMNPIHPTAYTQVVIAQSSSATIATPPSDYSVLYMLESLRGHHASVGNIWYWDPTSGSNSNDGTTPSNAVATFAQAQTLATAGNNDIIFALATDSSGVTTSTEVINVSKANLKIRGQGYSLQLKPAAGSDAVTISADNVEFSSFYIEPTTGGTDRGVVVTGDNALIKDIWVNSATSHGIDISSSTRSIVDTCAIEDSSGNGINIRAATTLSKIRQCIISGSTVDGVNLEGSGIADNIFENNIIYNNTGNSIEIGTGVLRTGIRLHHTIANNGVDTITDSGTDTFQDTSGAVTSGDIANIVDGVWDELISAHTTAGTAGRTLRDAKTRATLASLK
jgi:hypothetical protein